MFPFGWAFQRPKLPIECKCGDTSSETCTQIGLRNHRNFPPFAYLVRYVVCSMNEKLLYQSTHHVSLLVHVIAPPTYLKPDENDVDETYYALDEGMYSPTRHWLIIGEIVDLNFFIRPRATIETQYGERVLVNFHLDTPRPKFFNWEDLKLKHTLAIFYPSSRTFMDMNQGIRQESPDTAMVFPCSLDNLASEFEGYLSLVNGAKACFKCGKMESDDHKLLKCSRCKNAFYCGRDCQKSHWTQSHKKLCRLAPMLVNLAKLDFSHFENFVQWDFPTIVPPTSEEKKAKAMRCMRESLYNMGATFSGGTKLSQLDEFLMLIEGKTTLPAIKLICNEGSQFMDMVQEVDLPEFVRDSFLFKSLKEFTKSVEANPSLRHHVVDLQADQSKSGGFASMNSHEFISDIVLSSLFAAFPLWQHEEFVGGISWAFECHHPLFSIKNNDAFKSSVWSVHDHGDHDSLLIKNRVSDTSVFMSDYMELVAEIGEAIAEANPRNIVVRVLRITANESWSDCVRRIATRTDLPSNLYSLFIREEVALCGSFNPLDPDKSLVEQLLDTKEISFEELFLKRMGIKEENFFRMNPSESGGQRTCISCGERKSEESFSKTQRRRYGNEARCKECVSTF